MSNYKIPIFGFTSLRSQAEPDVLAALLRQCLAENIALESGKVLS